MKRWGVIFRVIGGVRATPRHWVEAFEAALVIGLTVLVVNALSVSSVGMWQSWNIGGWLTRIGILLSAGALVSSVYWVARRGPRKQVGLVVGGLCLSGQLMSSAQDPSLATIPGGWWGVQHAIAAGVLIVGCLTGPTAVAGFLAFLVGQLAILLLVLDQPPEGVGEPLWYLVVICMVAAMIAGILPSFRRTAMIADRAVTTRVLAEAARERLIGEAKSLRLMAGLLHDAVAHALRACALPPESISQLHVASQCREAVRVLDVAGHRREPPSSDLVAMVAAVVDGLSLSVAVTGAQIADPPPAVKAALAGAVGEALRNVEKHAGVTSAAVSIGPWLDTRAGVQIVVSDLGVGFDAGGVDDRRFGIRISLQQRLDDVGARCDIESGPGSGTTVRISWRPHPRTASASGLVDLAGTRLSIVQAGATPILIGALIGLSLHPGRLAEPIAVITTAVVVGVQIAAVVAVRWFAPGRLWAAVMVSVLLGGLWLEASAWHWYGGSGTTYGLAALICPGLALLAFYRPYPETWLTLAAVTGSLAWLMSGTQPGQQWLVPSLATIFSPAVAVVAVVMVRSRIDRIGPVVVQSEAAETTAQAERAQLAALRQVGERRIRHIRAQVQPYLAAVIDGTVNLRDASVRDRAAALEAAVRDDLQLGSALNPRTREVIEKARLRGATIEFNINTNGVHDYEPLLSSFVAVALSAVPQRLVFSATVDAARAMVSITALLTQAKWTDQVTAIVLATGGTARRTGDLLLLCVTGCGADPLPPMSRDVGTGAQSPADLKLGG